MLNTHKSRYIPSITRKICMKKFRTGSEVGDQKTDKSAKIVLIASSPEFNCEYK